MSRIILALAFVAVVSPVGAQPHLTLQMKDGRVTLEANAVPVRQILAEWARIGGTKIVGGDKVTGAPLTLHIVDMPERQALDIILRNVAGFMAAPRQASAAPGASSYDRIMILATSTAPAPAAAAAARTPATNAAGRRLPPRPPNLPPSPADTEPTADDQAANDDPADTGVNQQPVFTFPAPPGANGAAGAPVFTPVQTGPAFGRPGQPGTVAPVITLQPNANGQPAIYNFVPNDPNAPVGASSGLAHLTVQRHRLADAGHDSTAGSGPRPRPRTASSRTAVNTAARASCLTSNRIARTIGAASSSCTDVRSASRPPIRSA